MLTVQPGFDLKYASDPFARVLLIINQLHRSERLTDEQKAHLKVCS
jgi:hypothetical protein